MIELTLKFLTAFSVSYIFLFLVAVLNKKKLTAERIDVWLLLASISFLIANFT